MPSLNAFKQGNTSGNKEVISPTIRLLKHTSPTATRNSGSYEVSFPDGRPSIYFY